MVQIFIPLRTVFVFSKGMFQLLSILVGFCVKIINMSMRGARDVEKAEEEREIERERERERERDRERESETERESDEEEKSNIKSQT